MTKTSRKRVRPYQIVAISFMLLALGQALFGNAALTAMFLAIGCAWFVVRPFDRRRP